MNVNFGLLPPIDGPETDESGRRLRGRERGLVRKRALAQRALADFDRWLASGSTRRAA